MQSRRFSGLPLIGILAVIYVIAGKLGLMLASLHASASPVWPPAGIALAGLLLLGYRAWPAIFVGAFLVNVTTAGNVATAFAIATGNTLEALVGAWLVNRFAGGMSVFDRPQGVFKFALAAGISAVISPAFGVTSLGVAGFADWANYGAIWLTWWLGDATGDLVFTPLVLLWSVASKRRWNKKEAAEVGALLLLLVLLSGVVFGGWPGVSARNYPIALLCGSVVIWTAFRFTQRETATGIFILSAIAVWGTLHGFGPFVSGTENQSLLTLQWWTAVLSITAMALSAGMAERRRFEEELQQQKAVVETANRTKDHFPAMLSHELRTPITPVISALESLETEPAQTEEDESVEPKSHLEPEIAHLLLIDVAGYSKLSNNEQIELLQELNQIVRSTECFRSAEASGKLNRVPMGDGMALLFFRSPEEPVRCALEISGALRDHPHIRLRMGVHSGPVNRITDVNDKTNFAGSGINVAQRVLDCGDAGHILLSAHIAEDFAQYRHWEPYLHDLGECEVKHGLRLHLFNLYKDDLGNPQVPEKLRRRRRWKQESDMVRPVSLPRRPRSLLVLALVVAALAMLISSLTFFQRVSLRMTPSTPPEETGSKGTVLIPEKSIAILPFENLSGDKANAYFADGIHDEILMRLSKIADLKVISRTSTQPYKSAPENLPEIAKQLGVAHILEGRVQKSGDAVRVNVQLIKAANDSQLWAETFDRKLTDIFAVESDIAKAVADQLQANLSPSESHVLATVRTPDTQAYDLFLRGEHEFREAENSPTAEAYDRAVAFYRQALARDPNFAEAAAALARSRLLLRFLFPLTPVELEEVKSLIDRALALAPNSPEAHLALGLFFYLVHRRYEMALAEFNRTLELQPNNALAREYCAWVYRRRGEWERSLAYSQRAQELDPRDALIHANIASTYQALRLWKDAERAELQALAIDPHNVWAPLSLVFTRLSATGDVGSARRALDGFPEAIKSFTSGIRENGELVGWIGMWVYLDVIERRFTDAFQAFEKKMVNDHHAHLQQLAGRVALRVLAGQTEAAKSAGKEALPLLEARFRERPDDTFAMTGLSWVYLALGRNADALRLSRQAADTIPIEKDAVSGPSFQLGLAQVEARAGAPEEAIKRLRHLLSIPAGHVASIALLKIDPVWDPIRNRPDFQQLLSGPEQIGPNK